MNRGLVILGAGAACFASGLAAAEPCRPQARLSGDEAVVARVAAELERLGIAVERVASEGTETIAPATCPTIVAMVQADAAPASILVAVRGSAQASEGRVVSDATVAAAWIDSWIADDAAVAEWMDRTDLAPAPVALAPSAPAPIVEAPPGSVRPGVSQRFGISAAYLRGSGDEESAWQGFSIAACGALGKACLGARLDATFEGQRALALTHMSRRDIALLATASRTVPLGRVRIAAEAGAGVGLVTTARVETCTDTVTPPNGMDPTNPMPEPTPRTAPGVRPATPGAMCVTSPTDIDGTIFVGDNFSTTTITPRATLAMRLDVPLADWLWLEGRAGLALSPFAHTSAFATNVELLDGSMFGGAVSLPGEPMVRAELGIGVRVGLP